MKLNLQENIKNKVMARNNNLTSRKQNQTEKGSGGKGKKIMATIGTVVTVVGAILNALDNKKKT